jgi:hypothetical protein
MAARRRTLPLVTRPAAERDSAIPEIVRWGADTNDVDAERVAQLAEQLEVGGQLAELARWAASPARSTPSSLCRLT